MYTFINIFPFINPLIYLMLGVVLAGAVFLFKIVNTSADDNENAYIDKSNPQS
jgi:hypothetical protein